MAKVLVLRLAQGSTGLEALQPSNNINQVYLMGVVIKLKIVVSWLQNQLPQVVPGMKFL